MNRVLMIAYHFPPLAGSSGIQRTLRFVQQLPAFGWEPIVLTASPRAYERTSADLLHEVPSGVHVERAFALDAARHFSIGGRYPGALARPDRWISWRFAAAVAGRRLVREYEPQAIWSTFPIATAHVIAGALQRKTQLPWVADFRDPMAQDGYPADPRVWRSFRKTEEATVRHARFSVFTAPGAARRYQERYPAMAERIVVIENGFDEESFAGTDAARDPLNPGALTLLHSGIVYSWERDPTSLFAALQRMAAGGRLRAGEFKVRFRASSNDEQLAALAVQHGVKDFVQLLPPIPYRAALDEMVRADALLVLQAANCNEQIPAKLYEYMRAGRPILALTDPAGDTAVTLRSAGVQAVARLDCVDEIVDLLGRFADGDFGSSGAIPDSAFVAGASRMKRSQSLATLLDIASRAPR
ncbi:MAG: glycosyltransferase [Casimicrobiaceae bacterium]